MQEPHYIVPRKVKYRPPPDQSGEGGQPDTLPQERWLTEWRDESAYVLLGDPGSGKTESLKAEAEAMGAVVLSAAHIQEQLVEPVSAQDTVFIDAIDEAKGAGASGSSTVGAIARFLKDSGHPRFRIACREADWRVDSDRKLLEAVAPMGKVKELHLCPLSDEDILSIVHHHPEKVADPNELIEQAKRQRVHDLMRNPLLLDLMLKAVAVDGRLPPTRKDIYQEACRQMAQEHNERHLERQVLQMGVVDAVLEDAGTVCAIMLLSGKAAIHKGQSHQEQDLSLRTLPKALALHDIQGVLKSMVFTTEGQWASPRHRTLAEFLGAHALALRIQNGLPLTRVLALMQGQDGTPVESMRGLWAWLVVHLHGPQRLQLLQTDPFGFIINGDVNALGMDERRQLIHALAELSQKNPWFRNGVWESHPFGALATPDMADIFVYELGEKDFSQAREIFITCLMDALQHAQKPMPQVLPFLVRWVGESQAAEFVRLKAYRAWRTHCPSDLQPAQIKAWLESLQDQLHQCVDLVEALLEDAYPEVLQADVLRFIPIGDHSSSMWWFWSNQFLKKTPPQLLPDLASAWLDRFPHGRPHEQRIWIEGLEINLLMAVLLLHGETASTQTLYTWLGIGLDEYGSIEQNEKNEDLVKWLQARPEKVKAVALECWLQAQPDEHGRTFYPLTLQRLRGVYPKDWVRWQMQQALVLTDKNLVRYLLADVTAAQKQPLTDMDQVSAQDIQTWLTDLTAQHPEVPAWLQAQETERQEFEKTNNRWRQEARERQERQERHRAERTHAREQRRQAVATYLAQDPHQPWPMGLLHQIAGAYEKRFYDIEGETPEARVADYLGTQSERDVAKALQAIDGTLVRSDLPTVTDIVALAQKKREHFSRLPALLAAKRACERDPTAWRHWPLTLQQTLMAFWLTYGAGHQPVWFKPMGSECPDAVAPVLLAYVQSQLKRKDAEHLMGVYELGREPTWRGVAQWVLQPLLESFPAKVNEKITRSLSADLLSALHLLPNTQAQNLIERKLALKALDSGQRIAWLVAWFRYKPMEAMQALVRFVGRQHRRVVMLGQALREQAVLSNTVEPLQTDAVMHVLELLAPITSYQPDWPGGLVTDEFIRGLLNNLGNNPSSDATQALLRLLQSKALATWHEYIQFQLLSQQRLQREVNFSLASPQGVAQVLCQKGPANPGDLLALVVDHLRMIQAELRGDPASPLKHFWREVHYKGTKDSPKITREPRIENECTLELLALLRPRLQVLGVDVTHESQAAHGKRVDLRATCMIDGKRVTLPMEAKKEDHSEVWTAWRTQLQASYTSDPDAHDHGLYLVYWFGVAPKSAPPLDGTQSVQRPTSVQEMQTMLQARIPAKDRHVLQVIVLDLSWPPNL